MCCLRLLPGQHNSVVYYTELCVLQVASGHLRTVCAACGSSLVNMQPPREVRKSLEVFRNVARFHSFDLLAEITEWLLEEPSSFS